MSPSAQKQDINILTLGTVTPAPAYPRLQVLTMVAGRVCDHVAIAAELDFNSM